MNEVTWEAPLTAEDLRAASWWLLRTPGAPRTQFALSIVCFVLVAALVALIQPLIGLVVLVCLGVLVGLGPTLNGRQVARLRGPRPLRFTVDAYGLRAAGRTQWEVSWSDVSRFELIDERLLVRVNDLAHVLPLGPLPATERARLAGFAEAPASGPRPAPVDADRDPAPGSDPQAVVVTWNSTRRGTYDLQRFAARANPVVRRAQRRAFATLLVVVAALPLAAGLAGGSVVGGLVGAAIPVLVLAPIIGRLARWGIARRLPTGECALRIDGAGMSYTGPTGTWSATWPTIEHWGRQGTQVCFLAVGYSGIGVPRDRLFGDAWIDAVFPPLLGPPLPAATGLRRLVGE